MLDGPKSSPMDSGKTAPQPSVVTSSPIVTFLADDGTRATRSDAGVTAVPPSSPPPPAAASAALSGASPSLSTMTMSRIPSFAPAAYPPGGTKTAVTK